MAFVFIDQFGPTTFDTEKVDGIACKNSKRFLKKSQTKFEAFVYLMVFANAKRENLLKNTGVLNNN